MKNMFYAGIVALLIIGCNTTATSQSDTFKDVDVAEFNQMAQNKEGAIILDVRTKEETDGGMVPNAIHIDYHSPTFKEELSKLDSEKPILVYCAMGGRSKNAQNLMQELGFKEVYNLKGGYTAWSAK